MSVCNSSTTRVRRVHGPTHSVNVELATTLGLEAAVLHARLKVWLRSSQSFHEKGHTWISRSSSQMARRLGYMTKYQVRAAMKVLIFSGLVVKMTAVYVSGRNNWYRLSEE